ncbi:MAG: hypothetical protein R2856_09575 [Caldilineaceae bacterium]
MNGTSPWRLAAITPTCRPPAVSSAARTAKWKSACRSPALTA